MTNDNTNVAYNVKAEAFQIYKEACGLGAAYNKKLRAVDLRVMQGILSYLNNVSFTSFPGLNTIKAPLQIHKRTAQRSLAVLESEGHMRRQRRWNAETSKWETTIYLPLIPDSVMPQIELRFSRRPRVLATINKLRDKFHREHNLPLGSGVDLPGGSGVDLPPKPLKEPLIEPQSLRDTIFGSCPSDNKKQERWVGEEGREERGRITLAEIYRYARQHWGDGGANVIAKALEKNRPWAEIWEHMVDGVVVGAAGHIEWLAEGLLSGAPD